MYDRVTLVGPTKPVACDPRFILVNHPGAQDDAGIIDQCGGAPDRKPGIFRRLDGLFGIAFVEVMKNQNASAGFSASCRNEIHNGRCCDIIDIYVSRCEA